MPSDIAGDHMDLAVLIKQSIDVQELMVDPETDRLYLDDAPTKPGEIDLNAVEEAVRIKEKTGGKATLIMLSTWGSSGKRKREAREAIKRSLAMGIDRAILLFGADGTKVDTYVTAKAIAEKVKEIGVSLVLAGEGSEDNFTGLLPARLAAELGWPYVAYATAIEVEGDSLIVTRSLEDYEERVRVKLPAVVSVTQEINKPRIPKLMDIVRAGKKPVEEVEFSPKYEPKLTISSIRVPKVERKKIILEGDLDESLDKLIQALREEGILKG